MSAPLQAREELAVEFLKAMILAGRSNDCVGEHMVNYAFALADLVIQKRSPGS